MRKTFPAVVEEGRLTDLTNRYGTRPGDPYGAFTVQCPVTKAKLTILAGDGGDWQAVGLRGPAWEHVSVSTPHRCPTWQEMDWVKDQFFENEECVMQFHVPKKDHVNRHNFTLHLWRLKGGEFPRPPKECV